MLNEQFSGIKDRKYQREIINEIVRLFQDIESFMKIQTRRTVGRRHHIKAIVVSSKIEIMIVTSSGKQ